MFFKVCYWYCDCAFFFKKAFIFLRSRRNYEIPGDLLQNPHPGGRNTVGSEGVQMKPGQGLPTVVLFYSLQYVEMYDSKKFQ